MLSVLDRDMTRFARIGKKNYNVKLHSNFHKLDSLCSYRYKFASKASYDYLEPIPVFFPEKP